MIEYYTGGREEMRGRRRRKKKRRKKRYEMLKLRYRGNTTTSKPYVCVLTSSFSKPLLVRTGTTGIVLLMDLIFSEWLQMLHVTKNESQKVEDRAITMKRKCSSQHVWCVPIPVVYPCVSRYSTNRSVFLSIFRLRFFK
jgi:hypothetical protein